MNVEHGERLHKVVFDAARGIDHFSLLPHPHYGTLPHINVHSKKVNPDWEDYEEICVETYGMSVQETHKSYEVVHYIVLRGTLRCCCAEPCHYGEDHNLTGSRSALERMAVVEMMGDKDTKKHVVNENYIEVSLDLNKLRPLLQEARQRVPNQTERAAYVQYLKGQLDMFGLTPEDVESQLGAQPDDLLGWLSAPGAAAEVLAGTAEKPDDYYSVAAFVAMYRRWLAKAHTQLTREWPGRHPHHDVKFRPRSRN